MKKVFILLGFALLGGGSFGEALSNAPANGNAYTCPAYSCVSISVEMVFVQGGTLSSSNSELNGATVSDFYIGKYEVTQKQWYDVMGSFPYTQNYGSGDNYPVYYVSWNDAKAFIAKLNSAGGNFRLPTEAEWEYAAKGGNPQQSSLTYAGSNTIDDVAWYKENSSSKTHPTTDLKVANGIRAYNMSGNVWEWCEGLYSSENPSHVFRGGGWSNAAADCTVSYRDNDAVLGLRNEYVGFRLACSSNP